MFKIEWYMQPCTIFFHCCLCGFYLMAFVVIYFRSKNVRGMAEKARSYSRKARQSKKQSRTVKLESSQDTIGQGTEKEVSFPANDDDVIGKTKIVYLEDPEEARTTPARSEPLKKEAIEEDEEIRTDDVEDNFRQLFVLYRSNKDSRFHL